MQPPGGHRQLMQCSIGNLHLLRRVQLQCAQGQLRTDIVGHEGAEQTLRTPIVDNSAVNSGHRSWVSPTLAKPMVFSVMAWRCGPQPSGPCSPTSRPDWFVIMSVGVASRRIEWIAAGVQCGLLVHMSAAAIGIAAIPVVAVVATCLHRERAQSQGRPVLRGGAPPVPRPRRAGRGADRRVGTARRGLGRRLVGGLRSASRRWTTRSISRRCAASPSGPSARRDGTRVRC